MFLFLAGLSVVISLLCVAYRFQRARVKKRRAALVALMIERIDALSEFVGKWRGSVYELVWFDSDRDSRVISTLRSITLRLDRETVWTVEMRPIAEEYRLGFRQQSEERWYPGRYECVSDPNLKNRVDLLLWHIRDLPPPRTLIESMRQEEVRHEAAMAEYDAQHAEHFLWMEAHAHDPRYAGSSDDPSDEPE